MINIIAAIGKNNELGKDNNLIWHISNDLKNFRNLTNNKIIVMGYNTFISLPKLLPNRIHVVLTHQKNLPEGVIVFDDFNKLLEFIKDKDVFIIGGASIYKQFIDLADNLYLTEIDDTREADTYFTSFDKSLFDKEIIKEDEDKGIQYKFTLYKRRK